MGIVNHIMPFHNYQSFSDVAAEILKPASENSEPMNIDYKNSVTEFGLWRHDDHAE